MNNLIGIKMNEERYLYLIEFNNKYKIGVSKNPQKRLKSFSLGPEAKIVYAKQFPHVCKIEKVLHNTFETKKYSNEWFELDQDDIETVMNFDLENYSENIC